VTGLLATLGWRGYAHDLHGAHTTDTVHTYACDTYGPHCFFLSCSFSLSLSRTHIHTYIHTRACAGRCVYLAGARVVSLPEKAVWARVVFDPVTDTQAQLLPLLVLRRPHTYTHTHTHTRPSVHRHGHRQVLTHRQSNAQAQAGRERERGVLGAACRVPRPAGPLFARPHSSMGRPAI
jgi:hypothetical protein